MADHVELYRRTSFVGRTLEDRSVVGVQYIGITPELDTLTSKPEWQISRRVYYTTGEMVVHFANAAKFNLIWDNRVSYFDALTGPTQAFPGEAINVDNLTVPLSMNTAAVSGQVSVSTAIELKVGASRLAGRNHIGIQPIDGDIYIGHTSPITSLNGQILYRNQYYCIDIGDAIPLYGLAVSGTVTVAVSEVS